MFTGIIQNSGIIDAFERFEFGAHIRIRTADDRPFTDGESVAVNGVCLTVFANGPGVLRADISEETMTRTTLGRLGQGARVNVERALTLAERLGGHIVQGHVDAVGTLIAVSSEGAFAVHRWSYPSEHAPLLVSKGSIAVDGVSLTVIDPDVSSFAAALIPETLRRTTLGTARIGDGVNLEFDIIGKYVRNFAAPYVKS